MADKVNSILSFSKTKIRNLESNGRNFLIALYVQLILCVSPCTMVFAATELESRITKAISDVLSFLLNVGTWLGMLMFVFCAVMMVISTDDRAKQKWKSAIIWVIIAVIIMLSGKYIFQFIKTTFNLGSASEVATGINIFTN